MSIFKWPSMLWDSSTDLRRASMFCMLMKNSVRRWLLHNKVGPKGRYRACHEGLLQIQSKDSSIITFYPAYRKDRDRIPAFWTGIAPELRVSEPEPEPEATWPIPVPNMWNQLELVPVSTNWYKWVYYTIVLKKIWYKWVCS